MRSDQGRRITLPDPLAPVRGDVPAPLLAAETTLWSKPPAALAFPLHPLAALDLYGRAVQLLEESQALDGMDARQDALARGMCWRYSARLYSAGLSIRQALERAVETGALRIRSEDAQDPTVGQPMYLAAWAVLQAACDWAREGAKP